MNYKILALLLFSTAIQAQQIAEDVYQYVVTPVTDSTWNLDVVNVSTNPQQISRYSNMTKTQIDDFFYTKLVDNYQIIASNKYKALMEEVRMLGNQNILTSNLQFNYEAASNTKFKNAYAGTYAFTKSGEQPKRVSIDTSVYELVTVLDTVLVSTDTLINDVLETIVDTVVNTTVNRVELFQIIPVSSNLFKLKLPSGITIDICSEDRRRWIGKEEDVARGVNDIYYFRK